MVSFGREDSGSGRTGRAPRSAGSISAMAFVDLSVIEHLGRQRFELNLTLHGVECVAISEGVTRRCFLCFVSNRRRRPCGARGVVTVP